MYLPDLLTDQTYYQIAEEDEIELCGLVIDPKFKIQDYYINEVPGNMALVDRIHSGYFSERYLHVNLFAQIDMYFAEFLNKNLVAHKIFAKRENVYYAFFQNEEQAKAICNTVFDLFLYFLNRVQADYVNYYVSLLQEQRIKPKPKIEKKIKGKVERTYSLPFQCLLKKLKPSSSLFEEMVVNIPSQSIVAANKLDKKSIREYIKKLQPWLGVRVQDPLVDMYVAGMLREWILMRYLVVLQSLTASAQSKIQTKAYEADIQAVEQRLKNRELRLAQAQIEWDVKYRQAYQELMYRHLYINKFGYLKYVEVMKGREGKISTIETILFRRSVSILDIIGKKERDLILLEYKKENKFFQAMQNNREPWKELTRKLRHAPDAETRKKLYHDLRKYIRGSLPSGSGRGRNKGPTPQDWLRSKEGFPIICPHVAQKIEMEIRGATDSQIHDFLLQYAGSTPLYDAYYCRICGEVLTYIDMMEGLATFEGEQPIMVYHDADEGIKEYVWKQTAHVVRANLEYRDLLPPKEINKFISTIVSDLFEVIILIDKKIRRSRTNSLEEIDGKRKIYTVIYVWAILIKIILENSDKLKFNFQKGFGKVKADILFKGALNAIMTTQNILLQQLRDMSENNIKEALYASYTNLNALLTKSKFETPRPIILEDLIRLDPVYDYCALAYILVEIGKSAKGSARNIKQLIILEESVSPKTIFGKELDYEKPAITKLTLGSQTLYEKYYDQCYNIFVEYVQSKIYLLPIYLTYIYRDPVNVNLYTIKVDVDKDYTEYHSKILAPVLEIEAVWKHEQALKRAIPFGPLPFVINRQYPRGLYVTGYPDNLLARFYGNVKKFHLHKWNIFVYAPLGREHSATGNVLSEAKAKEFSLTPEFTRSHLIDRRCGICDLSLVHIYEKTEAGGIKQAIAEEQVKTNFFNYYQYRCPEPSAKQIREGDLFHQFPKGKLECSNCGATEEILDKHDIGYFNKYKKAFLAGLKPHKVSVYNPIPETGSLAISETTNIRTWKYNQNSISEMIDKTYDAVHVVLKMNKKIQYSRAWQNLGLIENYDYDKVLSGEENPSAKINQFSAQARVTRLDIYLKEFIFDYNILINYRNMAIIPVDLKLIMEGLAPSSLEAISKLPKFGSEYFQVYKEIRYRFLGEEKGIGDFEQVANFLLEYLIKELLKFQLLLNKQVGKEFGNEFLGYIIGKLFRMERVSAKLKEQKAAAVEAAQKISSEDDPNMQDHFQSRSFDGLVPAGEADKYSYEGMDYGGENEEFNT
jgi:hypothetical protein